MVATGDGRWLPCYLRREDRGDAAGRIRGVLDRAGDAAARRVEDVIGYAKARRCRHQTLAAHLGEDIPRCRIACDVCAPTAGGAVADERESTSGARQAVTPADALTVLRAIPTLPFKVGKTGLVRLLVGSVESTIRADRSPAFGRLGHLPKGQVERLVDGLVEGGWLDRDMEHDYKLISLTERGSGATEEDLAGFRGTAASGRSGRANPPTRAIRLGSEGREAVAGTDAARLRDALGAWRHGRASRDGVPAYVVATNAMLDDLSTNPPHTEAELAGVPGFGPKRVASYGEEILRVIGDVTGQ